MTMKLSLLVFIREKCLISSVNWKLILPFAVLLSPEFPKS